jgi:Dirigent-like protein
MKLTKRSCLAVTALGGVAAAAAIAVPSGSAQAPGTTTLSFYEPDAGSIFKVVDNPPKTFGTRPGPRSRFSIGDKLTFVAPLLDKKGGTRQGRLYADGTIVKGGTFERAALLASATYVLNDGSQIAVQGYLSFNDASTFSVVGGTGRYEGARGHVTSVSNADDSSTDTLTLLP